ncbi:helix-turn-helix domain-containing protein [Granulicella mallensis]|uniref:Transcriptional regulator with XRE-family HTH domain n=1 Tax=Granulicella mallensis TaxID=940614 RepID=A0A7W8EAQ7_9BACT|nr:helix-turn-helix transcriptional regulator [Granulicella mallensis]MBB5064966.1 transcriptional regulator with XRE-family HTH domain [Granulicella mallensis]
MAKPVGVGKIRKSTTPRERFGAAITQLRIEKKISQSVVAAKVGCEEFYLRNIEQGKENFSFDIMYAIVSYYDLLPLSRFWAYAENAPTSQAVDS